jgi:F-type H+-transporting ATPase subunit gamma
MVARGMASEKEIAARMKSTAGINKITKTMKMVAASKMRGDEDRLKAGRPFQKWVDGFTPPPVLLEDFAKSLDKLPQSNLLVVITTDRGLCGGVNSSLARVMKHMVPALDKEKKDVQLFIVGDKGRATMGRPLGEFITQINSDSGTPYNFSLAAALAQDVTQIKADAVHVVFNRFRSAIAYEATVKTLYPPAALTGEPYVEYEFEPDTKTEVLDDMYEMAIATTMFTSMLESAAAEQSSRMNAMENASKNGEDLIKELSIQYNRARQSRITTELVEIISGASALES